MKKAVVVKAYTDKNTHEVHLKGESIHLEEDRAEELNVGGFVKILGDVKEQEVSCCVEREANGTEDPLPEIDDDCYAEDAEPIETFTEKPANLPSKKEIKEMTVAELKDFIGKYDDVPKDAKKAELLEMALEILEEL